MVLQTGSDRGLWEEEEEEEEEESLGFREVQGTERLSLSSRTTFPSTTLTTNCFYCEDQTYTHAHDVVVARWKSRAQS